MASNSKNRYAHLIEDIFFKRYKKGDARVEFIREDIENTATQLDIKLPKNLGDVIYSVNLSAVKSRASGSVKLSHDRIYTLAVRACF
ncbi:MAG: hypothetical protein JNN15_06115 [Blastocatellia bacterium]|nr:hypothetical protein [Blastocatellia bacterium]